MGTSALGTLGLALEDAAKRGMQLLYTGPAAASFSLTTQPSGSTGMRLFLVVLGNTTPGTVSIAGTDIAGNAQNETTPTIPIQDASAQSAEVNAFHYVSEKVFSSVNANGVTVTGLTNAAIRIYGIRAAKYLIPSKVEIEEKFDYRSPDEHRGLLDMDTNYLQLVKSVEIGSIEQDLYPEVSLFVPYMAISPSPATITIPASPVSLAAAATASPISLTAQPTAPGMKLIITISGAGASGQLTIAGTNQYGQAVMETITAPGNGTYYSANVYSTVTSIGVAGLTGFSINVAGVYGWRYTFTPDQNPILQSAALEWYTGTDSSALPFAHITELEVSFGTDKETTLSLKGAAQDMFPIGDRSTDPLSASRVVPLGQPLDIPTVGWQTAVFIDSLTGVPVNTPYSSVLEGKVNIKVPQKPIFPAVNRQVFSRLYRGKREATLSMTIDFSSLDQYEAFRKNLRQFLAVQLIGPYIGSVNGIVFSKSWTFIFPAQHVKFARKPGDENVTAEIEARGIYTPALGYSHQLVVVCQQPPTLLL